MSRIDDALKLAQGGIDSAPAAESHQSMFRPAWSLDEPDETAAPSDEPGLATILEGTRPGHAARVTFSSAWQERIASGRDSDAGLVEQFRRLAATLHHAQHANDLKSVMVTSACPGDGKTLTAINLALVFAESYRRNVLLIDADLRRPSIPDVMDLSDGTGLSEALTGTKEQKLALVALTPRLTLLPAGRAIANSIEALTSPRMSRILEEAEAKFDWVVIDAPPVGLTTDARLLTQMVDGTLFVIRAGRTQYADVRSAIDGLGRERILGVVLNGSEIDPTKEYYYGPQAAAKK